MKNKVIALLLIFILAFGITGCKSQSSQEGITTQEQTEGLKIDQEQPYSTPQEVALYIHTYNQLPRNYLTKKEAEAKGWESNKGNLWVVTDKMSIGGDVFGNREGLLPKAEGRKWFECDVNYEGGFRGKERLVYSNDGLFFYTGDHYQSFTEIFVGEVGR